jgi:serine protease Do
MSRLSTVAILLCLCVSLMPAAAPPAETAPREFSVEELARRVKPSVVVVHLIGRDGKPEGVGTGFVVRADGLIATNQHVIGEGRSIRVETSDGKEHDVISVHASDRKADLALIKIEAKGLTPLPLGDAAKLTDGQPVVALGNPKGLKHSVVAGVVSGKRAVEGRTMIQVAIPIEPGNSGGPLLDRAGRVVGVMTIKSLVTDNLGFAMPVNALLPLIQKPNPVPMSAWLTIGALDPDEWKTKGGRWRQRAGRLFGEGGGEGVGRRSLCVNQRETPALPFEVGVGVKLADEAGAAGLAFHVDEKDRHYGFYPTGGKLRLVRFAGPDVFSWKVLDEKASPAYRQGEWNALKVRVEKGRLKCYVNDAIVFDVEDDAFTAGKVGLARFRDTSAEFRQFRVAKTLPSLTPTKELLAKVSKLTESKDDTKKLGSDALTLAALREKARQLEEQAAKLRKLAFQLHQKSILDELAKVLGKKGDADLIHGALLIAKLDNDEIDVDAYRGEVERMAKKVASSLKKGASEQDKLDALDRFLFRERGFHGSRGDYYNRSNSYLSEVIDDREGLPLTLAILYLELAKRLGVKVEGVGLPGHFVVRHVPKAGKPQLIDVYEGGAKMSLDEAKKKVRSLAGRDLDDDDLLAVPKKMILSRMLHNLMNVARGERDLEAMLRYADAIVAVLPDDAAERGLRAGLRYQSGDLGGALEDVEWLLEKMPQDVDLDRVRQMKRFLERAKKEAEKK